MAHLISREFGCWVARRLVKLASKPSASAHKLIRKALDEAAERTESLAEHCEDYPGVAFDREGYLEWPQTTLDGFDEVEWICSFLQFDDGCEWLDWWVGGYQDFGNGKEVY